MAVLRGNPQSPKMLDGLADGSRIPDDDDRILQLVNKYGPPRKSFRIAKTPREPPVKHSEVQLVAEVILPDALFPVGLSDTATVASLASRASRRARSRSVFFRMASWSASYWFLAFCLS